MQRTNDKKTIGEKYGQANLTDKKIKANPKYANTQSKLSTGATAKNVTTISDHMLAKRINEQFSRVNGKQLVDLLTGNNQDASAIDEAKPNESIYGAFNNPNEEVKETESIYTMASDTTKVVRVQESNLGVASESNILLLDMRDK